jgi:hypothetical protein
MGAVRNTMKRLRHAYAPHEHRPLEGYLVTMSTYAGLTGALAAAVKLTGRPVPERPATSDVVLISIATHKLSRLLAKEAVTSPLRAPFTRYSHPIGGSELAEEVRSEGSALRHSVGELVSCPFCLAVWVATGLTGGLVLAPRLTRLVATAMTAVAASDFLQMAYTIAKEAAEGPGGDGDDGQPPAGEPAQDGRAAIAPA